MQSKENNINVGQAARRHFGKFRIENNPMEMIIFPDKITSWTVAMEADGGESSDIVPLVMMVGKRTVEQLLHVLLTTVFV